MRRFITTFFILFSCVSVFAQSPDSLQKAAITKLDWWVGQWEGEAWMSRGPEKSDTAVMVETIRKDLDGTIIIIEGLGRRKMPNMERGDIVHHALAILSYDEKNGSYRWQSWRVPGGHYNHVEPTITDRTFRWHMDNPRGKMRYSARLNEKDQWEEIGEFSADGQTWRTFFGMLLTRVKK